MSTRTRFERAALPHMEAAFNLAYWLLRSRAEADDVVQDAYLRAYRAFDGFRGERIKPWLLAIVRNEALSALERRKRSANVVSIDEAIRPGRSTARLEIASDEPSAETRLVQAAETRELLDALAALPVVYRDVVVLRELEGLSYKEIAEVTGSPIGTVMSRLSRGREELRTALLRGSSGEDESNAL